MTHGSRRSSRNPQALVRGVNRSRRDGSVTVNVSSISFSNSSPVSPDAKLTSKFCAIIEREMRKLIWARFLPGQLYAPIKVSADYDTRTVAGSKYLPRENGKYGALSVAICIFLSPNRSGTKSSASCHHRGSL